ncbi:MAG: transporter substrate-binding domain-containing protein [Eubacteriales bacterium]|nr:transporter substrate-binding domain-containing protein [Eubacteriales bacterium]
MNSTKKKLKKVLSLLLCFILLFTIVSCSNNTITTQTNDNSSLQLVENGKFKVAMECAYAPYNWTQNDSSNDAVQISGSVDYAYGYDVMIAKEIAKQLNLELEIIKLDWDSLIPALISKTVDCVIAGQSITAERLTSVDFTTPYYYASIVTLTKKNSKYANAKSINDLNGAKATSQLNTVWYDRCLPQIPSVQKLSAFEAAPQMLVSLESGACDIVITDMPTAKAALIAYPDFTILDFSKNESGNFSVSDEDINIGCSLRKGNEKLLQSINNILSSYSVDDYNALMESAIKVQPLSN